MTRTRPVPFWATLLTLCGIIVLCGLGSWQVQRLQWKENILSKIETARAHKSFPVMNITDLRHPDLAWMPAGLRGHFSKKSFHVMPRTYEGKNGFHVVTPLILDGGGTILINRGWVPMEKEKTDFFHAGTVRVSGLLRPVPHANMFTPPNDPAKNQWYSIDPSAMAQAASLTNIAPYILYAETESGNPALPVRAALGIDPANNHLSYAIFWFIMAGILAVIYMMRFIK